MMRLFSTHPSTEDRVAKLQDLAADPRYNRLTA
jgi:Zn-dependent protease with chaperone function